MNNYFDWAGVLTGAPREWLISGLLTTAWVTLAGSVIATLCTLLLLGLRLAGGRWGRFIAAGWVSIFRNTPLLVQLLFWYFAAWNALPQSLRWFINDDHSWSQLPGGVWWLTPEFLCAAWGLGLFTSAFLVEEIRSGLQAVGKGQTEAALSQGFSGWQLFRRVLLPQGVVNAWQPVVGQYLNLMKLSSLATGIGFAELTSQVRRIESYNAHALAAFAIGTVVYLLLGLVMSGLFTLFAPGKHRREGQAALKAEVQHDS